MNISDKGLQILKHFEGCKLTAYADTGGVWTIGYGNTYFPDGRKVKKGDKISQAEAEAMLPAVLSEFEAEVSKHMVVPTTQHEFDAMVCLAYNIGHHAFGKSTLLRLHKVRTPRKEVAKQFHRWNKDNGKVLKGLIRRRASEAHLYEYGEVKFFL